MKPYFTVPANYSAEDLSVYAGGHFNVPIRELYGSLKCMPFGGGRHDYVLPDCEETEFNNYVKDIDIYL